jgi:penicillin-binding protein 1A
LVILFMLKRRSLRILVWLGSAVIALCLLGLIVVALLFRHYTKDLPSTDQLASYAPPVITRLYANDGRLLAEYAKEKRIFVPLKAIPQYVQQAFISAEDRNFYQHPGIDIWGIMRAAYANVSHLGQGNLVGGSTITQQVVKNFLLTSEKSIERKIKEAILAWRISKIYSKEKILELYLNQIYLGRRSYGVAAAAQNFFDRSLNNLSLEEAAMLAAMPKAPSFYDPARHYDEALTRRNYVLDRMYADAAITLQELEDAKASSITLRKRNAEKLAEADFFAEEVRRRLKRMYGDNVLYEGGLYVRTTLNPDLQGFADAALRHALVKYDRRHGYRGAITTLGADILQWQDALTRVEENNKIAVLKNQALAAVLSVNAKEAEIGVLREGRARIKLAGVSWARRKITDKRRGSAIKSVRQVLREGDVIIVEKTPNNPSLYQLVQVPEVNGAMVIADNYSGKILAMSGGYSYQVSQFNRATQARRQSGSAIKPFVYATALENGFSPTSVIVDGPIEIDQGPGLPPWQPKNYGGAFLGPTTLRMALEKSRNLVTVRLAQFVGLNRIRRLTERFGIYAKSNQANFSMVLGAKETTLMRLTNAYAMIANGGRRVEPWLIERIDDRNGTTIFRRDTRICESCNADSVSIDTQPPIIPDDREIVLDPRVAYQLTSILQGAVQRGTGAAARVLGRPVAGKTGTTNEERDAWFVGFTPDLVVGTYIGFDTPRPMGHKETGGRVAIAGFINFMKNALKDTPIKEFRVPENIRKIPVNRFTGHPLFASEDGNAKAIISEAFLTGGSIFKPSHELEAERQDQDDRLSGAIDDARQGLGPVSIGESLEAPSFNPYEYVPEPGHVAPYQIPQRPIENPGDVEGFDPNSGAQYGTGGLY